MGVVVAPELAAALVGVVVPVGALLLPGLLLSPHAAAAMPRTATQLIAARRRVMVLRIGVWVRVM